MANVDVGALYSLKKADTIRKGHYIVINGRACKVFDVNTTPTCKGCLDFVAFDIFNETQQSMSSVASSSDVQVPRVNRTDCKLLLILPGGKVRVEFSKHKYRSLQVNDHHLLERLRKELNRGKILHLTLLSAMGTEQICAVTVIRDIMTEL